MAFSKCVLCLKNSTQIPPKYLHFSNKLFAKLGNEISSQVNRFECDNSISFPFCSRCRIYLMKFDELNVKGKLLAERLLQLEGKQMAKIRRISTLQGQVGKNQNDVQADDHCDTASNSNSKSKQPDKVQDRTLPKISSRQKLVESVQQVSEKVFIFKGKYPFERMDSSFKCGSCSAISKFSQQKRQPIWYSIIKHINTWHIDSCRPRKKKIHQPFIEIAPNGFQYGKYMFEKSDKKWRCLTCEHLVSIGPENSKFKYISVHIDRKHENPGKNYVCELCGTQFNTSQAYKQHRIIEHEQPNGSYPCSICGKIFRTYFKASLHEKYAHVERRLKFICEICGKRFQDRLLLRDHIAFSHNGKKELTCDDCGKSFAARNALSIHQNSHTGRRKFVCDVCGMNFTQLYSVTRHKKTAHKN